MRTPKQIAKKWIDCTCDKAYTSRGLSAPDCPLCSTAIEEAISDAQREAKAEGIREMFAGMNDFFNALEKQKKQILNDLHKK